MSLDNLSAFIPRDSDVQLLVRLKRREPQALGDLFERFGGPILALLSGMAGNRETARGLINETFLTIWNQVAGFSGSGFALSLWILAVARNRALNQLHKPVAAVEFTRPQFFTAQPFAREDLTRLRDLHSAWFALEDKHRRIIELAFYKGMSRAEIALESAEPLPAIESQLKAALAALHRLPV